MLADYILQPQNRARQARLPSLQSSVNGCNPRCKHGFTLAELLVCLAILGLIAVFTIPKVLTTQRDSRYSAQAKEVASMISGAYDAYKQRYTPNSNTSGGDLTAFMNYASVDAVSTIDVFQTATTRLCDGVGYQCVRLHNGGMLLWASSGFMGTATTNAIYFYYDPDGQVTDGTTNGPGKSVVFWLYYNGRITSYANISANTVYGGGTVGPNSAYDPPWFQW